MQYLEDVRKKNEREKEREKEKGNILLESKQERR